MSHDDLIRDDELEVAQQVGESWQQLAEARQERIQELEAQLAVLRAAIDRSRRESFEAGFAARPPTPNNWDRVYVTGESRQWDFSPGGSAWDLRDDAWTAYLTYTPTKSDPTPIS